MSKLVALRLKLISGAVACDKALSYNIDNNLGPFSLLI